MEHLCSKMAQTRSRNIMPRTNAWLNLATFICTISALHSTSMNIISAGVAQMEWRWKNDHFGEAEEADNRIGPVDNEKLKVLFMERQAMQERLQNYAGIWSLGLDMLPTKEGIDHWKLYVNKSECCHIKAFFNQPTAQMPNPDLTKIAPKNGPIKKHVSIVENYNIKLDGIIKQEVKFLRFEIVDQLDPDKGMHFTVNFEEYSFIFPKKIDGKWTDSKIKNHFVRGAPFHLEVILSKDGMIINVNCNGRQNLDAEFALQNPHFINITGDFNYFNDFNESLSNANASEKSLMIEEGLHGNNSDGIMLKGKIGENAQKFTIKLLHQKDDGFYESILQLEIGIGPQYHRLLIGPTIEDCQKLDVPNDKCNMENVTLSYKAGSKFEAIFKFSVYSEKIEFWMDNILIGEKKISSNDINSHTNAVHFVQIFGDASANMTKIRKKFCQMFL